MPARRTGKDRDQHRPEQPPRRRWLWVAIAGFAGAVVLGFLVGGGGAPTDSAPLSPDDVSAGEELFLANCAACHGTDLLGTGTGPPFLNAIYAPNHHADEAFQRAAALGVQPHHWEFGPMPPVEGLTRDDVAKVVAFVRQQQQDAGIFRDPTHP